MINISVNLKQEAVNEQTSPKRLKFLASLNEELARLVAKNHSANSELLKVLASSKDFVVCAGVAGNPNAPPNVLKILKGKYLKNY